MTKKKEYITILSVFSCFGVVALHVNHCFWDFGYGNYWILANLIECIFYYGVPIFFMISGVTLIDYRKRYTTKKYFEKRIYKTVIPYIAWTIIGIIWFVSQGKIEVHDLNINLLLDALMNSNIVTIYWFFIPLFAIYISIPFLSLLSEENRLKAYSYGAIVAFITISVLPLLFSLIGVNYNGSLKIPVAAGNIIFVLIGYLIDNYELTKKQRKIIYFLGFLGLIVHFFGTWYFSYQNGNVSRMLKGYSNAPSVMYSVAIFVFFKYLNKPKIVNFLVKITAPFSCVTFGIYLIHWYIIQIILMVTGISMKNVVYRTFGVIAIFLICALLVKIVQKIPVINNILPS